MFVSSVRSADDLAGVFEFEDDVGYFYLYRTQSEEGKKIVGNLLVANGPVDFDEESVEVRWNGDESAVGMLIGGVLWAAFSDDGDKYGGNYSAQGVPRIPLHVQVSFEQ